MADDGLNLKPKNSRFSKRKLLAAVGISLLVLVIAAAVYWWQQSEVTNLKGKLDQQADEIVSLEKTVKQNSAKKDDSEKTESTPVTTDTLKSIIQGGTYSDLTPYLADTVTVIVAASEGVGARTPAQAAGDLKYLDAGTDPWNFALPDSTLNEWRVGDYASYVPITSVVGESANHYVVSFQFDTEGKIAVIFMAVNSDLMHG